MTKADIARELYERNHKWLSRNEASDMVELLIDTLKKNLAERQMVKIAGFGTFTDTVGEFKINIFRHKATL